MAQSSKAPPPPGPSPAEPPLKLYERPSLWEIFRGHRYFRGHYGNMESHVYEDDLTALPSNQLPEKPVILSQLEEETMMADPSRREEVVQKARRRLNFRIWQQYLRPLPARENKLIFVASVLAEQLGPHDHRKGPFGDPNAPPQYIDEDVVMTAMSLINHETDRVGLAQQFRAFNRCLASGPLDRVVTKMFTTEDSREDARAALDCTRPFTLDKDTGPRIVERIPFSKATRWPSRGPDDRIQDS